MNAALRRFWFAALLVLSGTCGGDSPPAPGEKCAPNPDHWETTCFDDKNLLFCKPSDADGIYRWSDFSPCKMGTCSCGGGEGKQPWYPNARGRCNCWY
jgi:hypothetical protein